MVACAQEDIQIKKRLVEQNDKLDKQYAESVSSLSKNTEKLTESINRRVFVT